ncbi:unnamed protein product (macronuclear) [Paramecium tetraurelia]|uniref:HTH psq-type domain-containing protein n=1 Tax=Paramecium tetraurelia TaxID=5888 RepID=A0CRL4_PARTE|nr:uncharacterized protein GSPATT00009746001 [Paramecium tetraurelia]CAK73431.1 unnamed protein product [Paramecium tetraurelia]|eukprot:XP_001440828.1 hypothetical protein (macronuclear) [Paramecium tetraurelia strain d4-2]
MTSIQQNSQVEGPQEQMKNNTPTSPIDSDSSDSSYDFVKDVNQKSYLKRTIEEDQELLSKYKGKHGLKYQKISNEQRQQLIKQVTTTGCMIKHAARDLNINFSTAKAIMQIFRREGRMSKKRKRCTAQSEFKNPEILIQDVKEGLKSQFGLMKEEQCQQRLNNVQDNLDTIHFQQMEEKNRNQAIFIQQLKTQVRNLNKFQNFYLQGRANQLQQEIQQLNQNYSYLQIQYNQQQQMVRYAMPQYQQQFQF